MADRAQRSPNIHHKPGPDVDHLAPDHQPCLGTVCVLCLEPVSCVDYFANDFACSSCAEGPDVLLLATTTGGFFPGNGNGRDEAV